MGSVDIFVVRFLQAVRDFFFFFHRNHLRLAKKNFQQRVSMYDHGADFHAVLANETGLTS